MIAIIKCVVMFFQEVDVAIWVSLMMEINQLV